MKYVRVWPAGVQTPLKHVCCRMTKRDTVFWTELYSIKHQTYEEERDEGLDTRQQNGQKIKKGDFSCLFVYEREILTSYETTDAKEEEAAGGKW